MLDELMFKNLEIFPRRNVKIRKIRKTFKDPKKNEKNIRNVCKISENYFSKNFNR